MAVSKKPTVVISPGSISANWDILFQDFIKTKDSFFGDGYDFFEERKQVLNFIEQAKDGTKIPIKEKRYYEYLIRERYLMSEVRLTLANKGHKLRRTQIAAVLDPLDVSIVTNEDFAIEQMGNLKTGLREDSIELHTTQAARLFLGGTPSSSTSNKNFNYHGIKSASFIISKIFEWSELDNPYVDSALVVLDEKIKALEIDLAASIAKVDARFEALAQNGVRLSIVYNEEPMKISINFKTPYGYSLSVLLVQFDNYVRRVMSLKLRGLIDRDEAYDAINQKSHSMRSMFEALQQHYRVISNENVRAFNRSHWMLNDTDAHKKSVIANQMILGPVDPEILAGIKTPAHSRANYRRPQEIKDILLREGERLVRLYEANLNKEQTA